MEHKVPWIKAVICVPDTSVCEKVVSLIAVTPLDGLADFIHFAYYLQQYKLSPTRSDPGWFLLSMRTGHVFNLVGQNGKLPLHQCLVPPELGRKCVGFKDVKATWHVMLIILQGCIWALVLYRLGTWFWLQPYGESCMDTFCRPLILVFEPYILLQGTATKQIIPAVS